MQQSFQLISTDELNKIYTALAELKQIVLEKQTSKQPALGDWISQKEAMVLLGKKYTSLYKLRKNGSLIATNTRPIFYSLQSIHEFLNHNSK